MGEPVEEIVGPNVERFVEYVLEKGPTFLSFDWNASAADLTPDQRAEEVLRWQKQIDDFAALPPEVKMRAQIVSTYQALHELMELRVDTEIDDLLDPKTKPYVLLLSQIRAGLDRQCLHLNNWLTPEETEAHWELKKQRAEARRKAKGEALSTYEEGTIKLNGQEN